MLHNEARKLLVEGYEATHNAEAIAKIFHVNKYTVYHLEERKRKTGSDDLQTWRRGRAFGDRMGASPMCRQNVSSGKS